MALDRPAELRINAWDGNQSPIFDFPSSAGPRVEIERFLAPPFLPRPWDWRSPDVGWGLVLRDNSTLSIKDRAIGVDAPESIRRLLAARAPAPILRYQPSKPPGQLVRYYSDGEQEILSTAAPDRGIHEGQIPQYLLIYGSPAEIPWAVQYSLNLSTFVGRLDLIEEEGLGHYVDALNTGWKGRPVGEARKPLVWSADWGAPDITFQLRRLVAERLVAQFKKDADLGAATWLTGKAATCRTLADRLAVQRPGFICTTSHGMTGPLHDREATVANIGLPVDSLREPLKLDQVKDKVPGGAIWYSHACCSAGSDRHSRYADFIGREQRGGTLLRKIAEVSGARVAPLPRMLLGAVNPIGAFVGHVEPTFDWTLRDPLTKQEMTHTIIRCLYERLFTGEHSAPIGWAIADMFAEAAAFFGLAPMPGQSDDRATLEVYSKLAAIDRQNLVIIGDPTVSLRLGIS